MRYETTVSINADTDVVWRAMSTVERWPEWTPTVVGVRRLDDGPLRIGSRTEVRQPRQPRRVWTVTELVAGKSFTWTTTSPGLRFTAGHRIRSGGDVTVVALDFVVDGPLAPLARVFGGVIRGLVDTEARSLKARCEREER